MVATHPDPGYPLGRSDHETARLRRQAQLYGPLTRRLLIEAGVGPGMRVQKPFDATAQLGIILARFVKVSGPGFGSFFLEGREED